MVTAFLFETEFFFSPAAFFLVIGGTILGIIFGAMPGVNASMAVVLALPLAYNMDSTLAMAFLSAIYCASITGGGITAILFRVPGTPASAPTTLDGYPMARNGQAGRALGFSLVSSALGGIIGAVFMAILCPIISTVALLFSPSEKFAVFFLGFSILVCLDHGNIIKTWIAGIAGLLIASLGTDPVTGNLRFAREGLIFSSEVEILPIMIGLFAVGGVLTQTGKERKGGSGSLPESNGGIGNIFPGFTELWRLRFPMLRASLLGVLVGILPGAGATSASFLSYAIEKKVSRQPEKLGTGVPEGIVVSEAANNGAVGGSMVPLLSLGIPGGNAAAIIMAFLMTREAQVGPGLHPEYLSCVFFAMLLANIVMVAVAAGVAKSFVRILMVPYHIVGPMVVIMAFVSAYGLRHSIRDVALMAGAGVMGCLMVRLGYSLAALALGLVLSHTWEWNLRYAYVLSGGSLERIATRPLTVLLLSVSMLILLYPVVKLFMRREK
ncbi:MAG: tripartite tricarboxylate transporter permease [Lachnospiraceae bacterium]|jgi:putative tricarboxylic transport membrane protein|nr:tripartite tricarboxylate transporter permease [Lachnospiraceae bacterium]